MPNRNDPGVVVHLEHQPLHLILRHQFFFPFLRIRIHGTELINLKFSSVSSYPFLGKEDRSRALDINDRRKDHRDQRCQDDPDDTA